LRVSFVPSAMLLMISLLVGALPFATSDLLVGGSPFWGGSRARSILECGAHEYHRIAVFTAFQSTILEKRLRTERIDE
jgi:hypothetical protein